MEQGLHLITQSTPNGQKVQILLEELKEIYGTECKRVPVSQILQIASDLHLSNG